MRVLKSTKPEDIVDISKAKEVYDQHGRTVPIKNELLCGNLNPHICSPR